MLLCAKCLMIYWFSLCETCYFKSSLHTPTSIVLLCSPGYSLLVVRNSESFLKDTDNLTSQWTSDVLGVTDTVVCLAVDLVPSSLLQAKLFQGSHNGTVWNQIVFVSGTDDRIRGEFEMPLDRDASEMQIALFFSENATIHNISLQFGSCRRNGKEGNRV